MDIYIASSWKNVHAVMLLTEKLRDHGHKVISFVENNYKELKVVEQIGLDRWIQSEGGKAAFIFDTNGATTADLVIYISPSGKDAAAEVGAAWASKIPVIGLYAKGEDFGLMRRMIDPWFDDYNELITFVEQRSLYLNQLSNT